MNEETKKFLEELKQRSDVLGVIFLCGEEEARGASVRDSKP